MFYFKAIDIYAVIVNNVIKFLFIGWSIVELENKEAVSIGKLIRYFLHHWVASVAIVVVAVTCAIFYVQITPAKYLASAKIIVLGDAERTNVSRDLALGNYVELITSNRVLGGVENDQHDLGIKEIRDNITVTRDRNSEILTIDYTSVEPDRAASVVDSVIVSFQFAVSEMYSVPKDGVNILSAPIDSGKPINKSLLMPIALSLCGGLAIAIVLAFLRFDAEQRQESALENLTEAEKRQRRKLAREAETIRKQKVAVELSDLEARKIEAEERAENAKLRIAKINLRKIETQISKAEKKLEKAEKEKQIAQVELSKAKTASSRAELELSSTINGITLKEEKQIARQQSIVRRRVARKELKVNSKADTRIVRIRAQKRIEAEKNAVSAQENDSVARNSGKQKKNKAKKQQDVEFHSERGEINASMIGQTIIKRPLSEA